MKTDVPARLDVDPAKPKPLHRGESYIRHRGSERVRKDLAGRIAGERLRPGG